MLILGSSSFQRQILLNNAGIKIDKVLTPNIDENVLSKELPCDYVKRMALEKNENFEIRMDDFLITADTIVSKGRRILTKPKDIKEAEAYLRLLSGSRHRVFSCIYVRNKQNKRFKIVKTIVKFKRLSHQEIKDYLFSNEWKGKAGGYAIQGLASKFIVFISGSYSNVVGLPIQETVNLLNGIGYKNNY